MGSPHTFRKANWLWRVINTFLEMLSLSRCIAVLQPKSNTKGTRNRNDLRVGFIFRWIYLAGYNSR